MMWVALAVGVAGLIYALIARYSRNKAREELGETKARLEATYETLERLRHTIAELGAADPTLDDLVRMHDDDAPAA